MLAAQPLRRRQPTRRASTAAAADSVQGTLLGSVGSWTPARSLFVELHRTPDMVALPPGGSCDCIITPANEQLIGTQLSYFPTGGPCPEPPPKGVSNSWGGMEAGSGMLYPTQCVDGRVHAEGGAELRAACVALPVQELPSRDFRSGVRCPVGSAALTPATGRLTESYRFVLHTVAPFRSDERWEPRLLSSFIRTWDLILFLVGAKQSGRLTVAVPLLGSGARGASIDESASVAVKAVSHFARQLHKGGGLVLRFAVVDNRAEAVLRAAFSSAGWPEAPPVVAGDGNRVEPRPRRVW